MNKLTELSFSCDQNVLGWISSLWEDWLNWDTTTWRNFCLVQIRKVSCRRQISNACRAFETLLAQQAPQLRLDDTSTMVHRSPVKRSWQSYSKFSNSLRQMFMDRVHSELLDGELGMTAAVGEVTQGMWSNCRGLSVEIRLWILTCISVPSRIIKSLRW